MIGMHSVGECVKLLEKDPWTPDPDDVSRIPDCFVMDRVSWNIESKLPYIRFFCRIDIGIAIWQQRH